MTYDRELKICTAGSRDALFWAPEETTWPALAERLKTPRKGTESHAAYLRMTKAQQDRLKDVGGFLGGSLKRGRRKIREVTGRDLVTLDLDAIPAGGTDGVLFSVDLLGCAACVYSTRKHDAGHPRLRVILPLKRTVTGEEYEPLARGIAGKLGIETADPTCFRPNQMMYWPNVSCDSEYVYEVYGGPALDPDAVLGEYADWRDARQWPRLPAERAGNRRSGAKLQDPAEKTGVVGAFCRRYGIARAMDELIPGVYLPTDDPERWTYAGGSTSGGAVVYEDKWLYSHHATDPCSGQEVNAWDLVRIHKFAAMDEDAAEDAPVNRLPSFAAMRELAMGLDDVKRDLLDEARSRISEDFGTAPPDGDWRLQLKMGKNGDVLGTLVNLRLICDNDPSLQAFGYDTFLGLPCVYGKLPWDPREERRPWSDADDNGAAWYAEAAYGIRDLRRIKMAVDAAMADRRRDALREYLEGLAWDGAPRAAELLIRYLKAEDTPYTRAVTRKWLAGCAARGLDPGCKFDSVLTLIGAQGAGKSLLADILGGDWYNDSIQTFTGKEAAEQLRAAWIVEIPEVDRFSGRFEASAVKQFITRRDDIYRVPFERRTTPHPRRCAFIATTNAADFLVDATGNRRWWIVRCAATQAERGEDLEQLRRDRDQVWAEAVALWRAGEPLTLDGDIFAEAGRQQESAVTEDPWQGIVEEFARRPVPADWDARKPEDRRLWWADEFGRQLAAEGLEERRKICAAEVWYEAFGRELAALDGRSSRRIMNVLRKLEGWTEIGARPTVYGRQKCFFNDGMSGLPADESHQSHRNHQSHQNY